jgi:hypothetical protein
LLALLRSFSNLGIRSENLAWRMLRSIRMLRLSWRWWSSWWSCRESWLVVRTQVRLGVLSLVKFVNYIHTQIIDFIELFAWRECMQVFSLLILNETSEIMSWLDHCWCMSLLLLVSTKVFFVRLARLFLRSRFLVFFSFAVKTQIPI